ncbi:Syncytin-2 [Manis pentadactyla]|nr:Syncytin-2 [Manis pentadactyla]
MMKVKCHILALGLETLALRKELGTVSDEEERKMVNCQIQAAWLGLALAVSHEHHEELSSGSDVMGIVRWWIRAIVREKLAYDMVTERIRVNSDVMAKDMMWTRSQIDLGTYSDVRVKARLDLHHHGVASETSMLTLRFQVKGPVLRLGLGNGQIELQLYGSSMGRRLLLVSVQNELQIMRTLALWKELDGDMFRFRSYSDVRAEDVLIFIFMLWHRVDINADAEGSV